MLGMRRRKKAAEFLRRSKCLLDQNYWKIYRVPGFDHTKISEKYGVSVSKPTISSILKNEKMLLEHFDKQMLNPGNKKNIRNWVLHEVKQREETSKQSNIEDFFRKW